MLSIHGTRGKSIYAADGQIKIVTNILNTKREKVIPIQTITGINIRKPGFLAKGFIQVQVSGQNTSAYGPALDDNSVMFAKEKDYKIALAIQEYINERTI